MRNVLFGVVMSLAMLSFAHAGDQDFELVNASSSPICYVYISPSNANNWGDDVLGSGECMGTGEAIDITFNGTSQKLWDLRVEDSNGRGETYRGFNLMEISQITVKGGGRASYQ